MKKLVITSDDFGISHSVNRGIAEGFNKGLLTSTNFMVPAPWFSEAFKLAKDNNFPVGIHLTLTCEWTNMKFGPITKAPSLTGKDGYFYSSYKELIENMNITEVENEYRAQIQRVIDMGIKPTHVETHMLTPKYSHSDVDQQLIAKTVTKVAEEFGLIYTYGVKDDKLQYFDDWFELTHKTFNQLTEKLESWGNGVFHLICHCGHDTEEQRSLASTTEAVYAWSSKCRQNDLDIITSERLKDLIKKNKFKIIGLKELLRK